MKATYKYRLFNPLTHEFALHRMRVEVLEKKAKTARVKFLEPHARGKHGVGYVTNVYLKNLTIDGEAPPPPPITRNSITQWLPYKD